ncbi:MAG: MBL fold metallo-hydrolase [Desulfobacterales bacterium]|nr:MBL fold metallo-hydrolase [Desulfobacterales bacterium]
MRIKNLTSGAKGYTCNVYLVQGDWDSVDDVNTLIDVGTDDSIIPRIKTSLTGIGKKTIDQILLTHGDHDHIGILSDIKAAFSPIVFAGFTSQLADKKFEDGQSIRVGDKIFAAIYAHTHGNSVCFLCEKEGVIFSGDVPIHMCHEKGSYPDEFLRFLEFLASKDIKKIYPGHGEPILKGAEEMITDSLIKAQIAKRDIAVSP